jgi:hypothetical protein
VVDGEEEDNPKWPKQWVMTENKSSSWCMKNTMDLEVPRGEAKFVLMCINLNYKNNSHFIHIGHKHR